MTASNKGSGIATQVNPTECCMCGDCGFAEELILCHVCQFRSQHRYCSSLYPKADSSRICNWCLTQKQDSKEKSSTSHNSSSSCRTSASGDDDQSKKKKTNNSGVGKKGRLPINNAVKKNRSPEAESSPASPSPISVSPPITVSSRKRIITKGRLEENLRRTRSDEISNRPAGITKPVFRSKARRYKLLEEVSS